MVKIISISNAKGLAIICACAMAIATIGKGFWLLLATISLGSEPVPRADILEAVLFIAFFISTCLFWKFPWLAVLVAWVDLAITVLGLIPWVDHTFKTFIYQFMYDHIFFLAANLGACAVMSKKQLMNKETF